MDQKAGYCDYSLVVQWLELCAFTAQSLGSANLTFHEPRGQNQNQTKKQTNLFKKGVTDAPLEIFKNEIDSKLLKTIQL